MGVSKSRDLELLTYYMLITYYMLVGSERAKQRVETP